MSKFLLNRQIQAKGINSVLRSMGHQSLFYSKAPAFAMENQKSVSFSPVSNLTPGSTTTCEIKVNYATLQEDLKTYIVFDARTTDAVNFPTSLHGAFDYIQSLEFEINDSSDKVVYDASTTSTKSTNSKYI